MSSEWYSIHFSFQTSLPHLEFLPTCLVLIFFLHTSPTHLNITGKVGSRVASSCSHSWGSILTLRSTWGGSIGIPIHQSMSALLHLEKSTTSASLGFELFQPSSDIQVRCLSSSCIGFPSFCPCVTWQIHMHNLHASCGPVRHTGDVIIAFCTVFEWYFVLVFCLHFVYKFLPPHGISILILSVPLPLCLFHLSGLICTSCSQVLPIILQAAIAYYKSRKKMTQIRLDRAMRELWQNCGTALLASKA